MIGSSSLLVMAWTGAHRFTRRPPPPPQPALTRSRLGTTSETSKCHQRSNPTSTPDMTQVHPEYRLVTVLVLFISWNRSTALPVPPPSLRVWEYQCWVRRQGRGWPMLNGRTLLWSVLAVSSLTLSVPLSSSARECQVDGCCCCRCSCSSTSRW